MHYQILAGALHEDQPRDETVELVDAHQCAHPGLFDKAKDRLGVLAQRRQCDLEQLVARIGSKHIAQHLAGMVGRVEARLVGALLGAALFTTRIFELTHAEEGEIVVAQPFEEWQFL